VNIDSITAKLNESLDFSDRNIEETAELFMTTTAATRLTQSGRPKLVWTGCGIFIKRKGPTRGRIIPNGIGDAMTQSLSPDGKTFPVPVQDSRM
jgi:hypothetical protein